VAVLFAFFVGLVDLAAEMAVLRAGRFGLGASPQSTAILLSLALAGFGVGAALSRRYQGARAFAAWRVAAGIFGSVGALATLAAASVPGIVAAWVAPALSLVSAAAFSIPSGASIPLLFAWTRGLAVRAAILFAANAIGSIVGVVLGGVVGPIHAGTGICALAVFAVNLAIALLAFLRPAAFEERRGPAPEAPSSGGGRALPALGIAFSAGAATIACEALFARIAPFFLDERSDALATVLASALFGLAVGGAMCGLLLRRFRAGSILGVAIAAIAFCGPVALFGLELFTRDRWISAPTTPGQWLGARFLLGGALFAPLFVFVGILSPLAFDFARGGGRDRAATVNLAYAIGALVPAWLVPALLSLGVPTTALLGCVGLVALPAGLAVFGVRSLPVLLPAAAAAFLGSGAVTARVPPFRTRPWLTPLETLEGPAGVAAVVLDRRRQELALFTNAFRAAATGDDYRYTRSLAHIPSLLCAKPPERVAVIAVGTGSTAAAALRHKSVRRLDMVEISSEVFSLLPWFRPASDALFPRRASGDADKDTNNTPPTLDPRIVCDVEDGRRFVAKEGEPYDLVILEPLFPDTPSAYPFYTKQFYALAKARLDKGGILAQWIPIHATEPLSFRALVATFSVSFPHRAAYLVGESLLLLGSEEPLGLQAGRLAEALQSPELAADLRRSGCASVGDLVAQCVLGDEGMGFFGTRHPLSDDAPRIERLGILTKRDPAAFEKENLGLLIRARETFPNDPLPGLDQLPAGEQEARRAAGLAYLRARRALVLDESETLDPSDGSRDRGALTETTPHPFAALDGQRDSTARSVREGRGYLASGDVRSALRVFEKAAAVARDPVVWLGLALAYYRSDRAADAGFAMAVALALEPDSPSILPPEWNDPKTLEELAKIREPASALVARLPNDPRTLAEVAEALWSGDPPRRIVALVTVARDRDRLGYEIERLSESLVSRPAAEIQAALTVAEALADPTLSATRAKLAAALRK
jgi:spermidine synthase